MTELLLDRARSGDEQAFAALTDPFRRELHVHCYRILGSLQDAEDALQETMLAAWRGLDAYEQRASLRTWLYRIATNRCLNSLRATGRRAPMEAVFGDARGSRADPGDGDHLARAHARTCCSRDVPDSAPGQRPRYAASESISLAFITILQWLPPRQRAC